MLIAKSIASAFGLELKGNSEKEINQPSSVRNQQPDAIMWVKSRKYLEQVEAGTVLTSTEYADYHKEGITFLYTSENVRLLYSKIINRFFPHLGIKMNNQVDQFRKRTDLTIGDFVYIGEDVEIGSGTVIWPNVVIHNGTRIGKNCVVKSFCSIASEGLGYEMDGDSYFKFPQIGGVIMHDNVEIGPNATIRRAALDNTIIGEGTKIGAFVNIGHNCIIGKNCLIVCQGVTGGSSEIGDNVFFGINALLLNGADIGSNVTVGMGAVVVKSVPDDTVVIGNPAQPMDQFKKWSRLKKKMISQKDPVQ